MPSLPHGLRAPASPLGMREAKREARAAMANSPGLIPPEVARRLLSGTVTSDDLQAADALESKLFDSYEQGRVAYLKAHPGKIRSESDPVDVQAKAPFLKAAVIRDLIAAEIEARNRHLK
jgi:hypothetical protein